MYSSSDFQREVIARTEDFYQRNDNSTKSFVFFEISDASNVIIDEWKTLMLNNAIVFHSNDTTTARKHIQKRDTVYVFDENLDKIVKRISSLLIEHSYAMQIKQKLVTSDTSHSHWQKQTKLKSSMQLLVSVNRSDRNKTKLRVKQLFYVSSSLIRENVIHTDNFWLDFWYETHLNEHFDKSISKHMWSNHASEMIYRTSNTILNNMQTRSKIARRIDRCDISSKSENVNRNQKMLQSRKRDINQLTKHLVKTWTCE